MSVIASEVIEEVEKFNDANARKRYSFYEALNFGFYASFANEIFLCVGCALDWQN